MRPTPFENGEWVSLVACFDFRSSGVETTRDHLAYDTSKDRLSKKVADFLDMGEAEALDFYSQSRKANFANARIRDFEEARVVNVGYRPLDVRALFNDPTYVDWPRPKLQSAWGTHNVALFGMAYATGAGPAIWCHGNIPDRHALRGSTGGYVFPLYDRRGGPDSSNLSPALVAALAAAYGAPVAPEDVFDAILALLSATSYTRRFAEDLEDVFPHIPFPADPEVFARAVSVGREIRAVETFARQPRAQPAGFCRLASEPTGDVTQVLYRDGEIALCADGSGRITGIPEAVWTFSVSGYRVLPRWIEARIGLPADLALIRDFRDVAARIVELIHRFDEADLVLEATLADTLTREELGFAAPAAPEADEGDD